MNSIHESLILQAASCFGVLVSLMILAITHTSEKMDHKEKNVGFIISFILLLGMVRGAFG